MGLGGQAAKLLFGAIATAGIGGFLKASVTDPIEDDPEKPRARDGAPAIHGPKTSLDKVNPKYNCETKGWLCDNEDVQDHLHTLNRVMGELSVAVDQNLAKVAPSDDPKAAELIGLATQYRNNFINAYGSNWTAYVAPDGAELATIEQIDNATTDAVILKNDIMDYWDKLTPTGSVPQGNVGTGWRPEIDGGSVSAPYAAAGAVAGIGLAMVAIIALQKDKTKQRV